MKATGWLKGLQVTADGTGIVSHAGVVLLRALADNTGLTTRLSQALASDRLLVHDRGRVMAGLACAIADGAEVISDVRVMGDQEELFGLVAPVPTAWRTLAEIAGGGQRPLNKMTAAVNTARRCAWAQVTARHGALPGVRVADKRLDGVTCIRLDPSVVTCHRQGRSGAELQGVPSAAGLLRQHRRAAGRDAAARVGGSNTAADHLAVLDAAVTALPPGFRRRLMVTCDGAGASHDLIARLDKLAARPGHQLTYSVGWELGGRERDAIGAVPTAPGRSRSMPWLRLLALDAPLVRAEPKTLRYRILHTAGRLVRSGRRRFLKIAATWPWAPAIATAWNRVSALAQAP